MSSESRHPLVVDVGGTKTIVAAYRDGAIEMMERFPTPEDPQQAVDLIEAAVRAAGSAVRPGAIGIGAPGPLDARAGRMVKPPNLKGWWDYPLTEMLTDRLGVPARLENDANLGALGEAIHGSGRGLESMFYLTISTGIGSGFIINDRIHGGRNGMAGEVWAMRPGYYAGTKDGPTVMDLASGPGLLRQASALLEAGRSSVLDPGKLDTPSLVNAAMAGDELALEVLDAGRDAVAGLLVSIIETVAPEAIVLGGGLCTEPEWYVDPVRERIRNWTDIQGLQDTPLYRAHLWDNAVLYGAATMVEPLC